MINTKKSGFSERITVKQIQFLKDKWISYLEEVGSDLIERRHPNRKKKKVHTHTEYMKRPEKRMTQIN